MTGVDTAIPTCVGALRVRTVGAGPPAVLWHSLFVDRTSWGRVEPALAVHRSLVIVESPGHGGSQAVGRDYSFDELATAATEILDQLEIADPVDWVGSALGGHVGIVFAARHPQRCRSLFTIGTPVHDLSPSERRQMKMLSLAYPVVGPRPVTKPLLDALLGTNTKREDHEAWEIVARSFRGANRAGMAEAIRCASLLRPDLNPTLSSISAPTVFATGAADPMWSVADTHQAATRLSNGAAAVLPGDGHIGPLFHSAPQVAALVAEFWREPDAVVARLRSRG